MLHVAVVAFAAACLMGCSATAEDAGDAPPGSETTNLVPTTAPTAASTNAATAPSGSAPQDDPLAGLDPCDLIPDDEAAQFELADAQPQGDTACAWSYTGQSDQPVYALVAFQHENSSLDDLVEQGNEPVPGPLGSHEAAVGAVEEGDALACRVAVVVGESSAVFIGVGSPGFASPSDPLCGDFSNQLARHIEPKLPVVEASASASEAGTEAGLEGPLAQMQPCDLISDDEAAQLSLGNNSANNQDETPQCAWLYEGGSDRLAVILSFEPASIDGIAGSDITPVPSIGSHDAATFTSAINAPAVAIGVDEKSRVDVQVGAMQLGESPDPAQANQLAMDVATAVEPKLP
jgi:hypothetical protein